MENSKLYARGLGTVRQFLVKLKSFSIYLVIAVLCCAVNFFYFQYLFKNQNEEDITALKTYVNDISKTIINDVKNALNGNKGLLFFSNFSANNNVAGHDSYINYRGDHIYVITYKNVLVLEKERLSEFIRKKLPPYVNYQIFLDRFNIAQSHINIASNKENSNSISIREKFEINKSNKMSIRLEIDPSHPDYLANVKNLYINALLTLLISIGGAVGLLHFYLKQQYKLKMQIRELQDNLAQTTYVLEEKVAKLDIVKTALMNKAQFEQQLKKMFIRNATAIYIDNNIPGINMDKNNMSELSNFLFPIAFSEPANDEKIDINKLEKDLKSYLAYEAIRYNIKIEKQTDTLKVQCSEIAFYQLLFSLVSNLILLMPQVSDPLPLGDHKKKFTVTFQEEKIIIDFETFPLNAEQIAGFVDKKIPVDTFFLDYKRVLESLKVHNIRYCVTAGKSGNRFELDFKKRIPKGKPHLRIVE